MWELAVFDAEALPPLAEWGDWYEELTEWLEDHGYDDPEVSSPRLQRWFAALAAIYPVGKTPPSAGTARYLIGKTAIHLDLAAVDRAAGVATGIQVAKTLGLAYQDFTASRWPIWVMNDLGEYLEYAALYGLRRP